MESSFEILDVERGLYDETKTDTKKERTSLAHIRKMIVDRQIKREAFLTEIDGEIDYWKGKEATIKKLPGFVEPTKAPDAPEEEPEEAPEEEPT